jgi:hypothetical protein
MPSTALPPFAHVLNVMKKAGLSPTEMIRLLHIGRATFYNWKKGQPISDLLRYRLTMARCTVIIKATEQERLPLSEDVPQGLRMSAINQILLDMRGKS